MSAKALKEIQDADPARYDALIATATLATFVFKVKMAEDTYQVRPPVETTSPTLRPDHCGVEAKVRTVVARA